MGKTLIGPKNVEQHICREDNALYLDNSMILTCGVKDCLRSKGVAVIYGKRPEPNAPEKSVCKPCTPGSDTGAKLPSGKGNNALQNVLEIVICTLKEEHGVEDPGTIEKLSLEIISRINAL